MIIARSSTFAAAAPPHVAVGNVPAAPQIGEYAHAAISVIANAVSFVLNHPSPSLTLFGAAVNVSTGSVETVPVGVYENRNA